eukprot:1099747-Rhodomonas_salina.1
MTGDETSRYNQKTRLHDLDARDQRAVRFRRTTGTQWGLLGAIRAYYIIGCLRVAVGCSYGMRVGIATRRAI